MKRRGCLVGAIVLAFGAAPAGAATRFASPTGVGPSGLNQCTEPAPCGLEPAVEDASVANGDEVLLLPGPYNLAGGTLAANDDIVIRPRDPGTRPVINGTSATTMVSLGGGADLRDVAVNHTLAGTASSATLFVTNSPATIVERVAVSATLTSGINHIACEAFEGVIRDSTCLVTGGDGGAFPIALGAVVGNTGTYTPEFVNVTTWSNNGGSGIQARASTAGVTVNASARNVIANGAGGDAIASAVPGATATLTLAGSNYNSSAAIPGGGTATVTAHGTGTNQIAAPLLANPDAGDFHQLTGSPTINAGAPDALLGTLDIDSQARGQGSAPDIGADEFNVPATPTITGTDPSPPSSDNSPEVKGTAEAGSTVKIYSTSDCSGTPLAAGTAAQFASPGITTPVPADATTSLGATASDSLDHPSACSAPFAYAEDSTPPPVPQIIATDPVSPANDNNPEVKGAADSGSTVRIFSSSDCSGASLATGTAAQFASPGLTVTVADNTTTDLRATASDGLGNESACSGAFAYTESSTSTPPADKDAPETKIDSAPKPTVKTSKKKARFEIRFSANETATFRCSLDGAAATRCSSPFTGKVGKGAHSFKVTATDIAGNKDPSPAKATWKVKRKKRRR